MHQDPIASNKETISAVLAVKSKINKAAPHDIVSCKAYYIYLDEGCPDGRSLQHWLAAENQLAV